MQNLVLARTVDADVFGRAIVRNLGVESRQFGHLDEVTETLLLHDLVGHGELVVDAFLGEHGGPGIERADVLPFEFLGTQIFEQQIELRQRV